MNYALYQRVYSVYPITQETKIVTDINSKIAPKDKSVAMLFLITSFVDWSASRTFLTAFEYIGFSLESFLRVLLQVGIQDDFAQFVMFLQSMNSFDVLQNGREG